METLSPRLQAITTYIDKDDYVADIGSDHGFLAIALRKSDLASYIEASENKRGPYEALVNNVRRANTENLVVKFSDGLEKLGEQVNTLVLAGLGATSIVNILLKDEAKLGQINKIIALPHNEAYNLRKALVERGFYISAEQIIHDNELYYELIVFKKGASNYSEDDLVFGPHNLANKSEAFKHKWEEHLSKINYLLSLNLDKTRRSELETYKERIKKQL